MFVASPPLAAHRPRKTGNNFELSPGQDARDVMKQPVYHNSDRALMLNGAGKLGPWICFIFIAQTYTLDRLLI